MIEALRWQRDYVFDDKKVQAEVVDAKLVSSGAIEVSVKTSCLAREGEIRHQNNSTTLTDPTGGQQLEQFMYGCADWLKTLIWEQPQVMLFAVSFEGSNGARLNLTCTFNIHQPYTTIDPLYLSAAGLPQTGTFVPPENRQITFAVHRTRFWFGKRMFETDVVAVTTGSCCVIGSDLMLQAAGENGRFLYDLFMTDIVRALAGAARSKEQTVLILGSYGETGRQRLGEIRRVLDGLGLEGIILDDFVDIRQQSLFEKMLMFSSFARFLICDESMASGHLIELKACADIGSVTAILRNQGKAVTWMNSDIAEDRTYQRLLPTARASRFQM